VTEFKGSTHVEAVVTSSGKIIECEMCVVGVGMQPNVEWLQDSAIALENGVLVDAMCETNVPGIFAAGDVANHDHPLFGRIRVEHWQNAINQGAAAARNMIASDKQPYADPHWFWSDQYEASLQYTGHASANAQMVLRGAIEDPSFVAFFLRDGRLEAAFALNNGRDLRRAMKLIGKAVDPSAISNPDVDLRKLG
jgi:3-phenylpropionate/trans-cinnamate dioxygenase ferredoxin reductase subunit